MANMIYGISNGNRFIFGNILNLLLLFFICNFMEYSSPWIIPLLIDKKYYSDGIRSVT